MCDHNECQGTLGSQVSGEPGDSLNVEVVCRLIQDHQIDVIQHERCELDAAAFTTGQLTERTVEAFVIKAAEQSGEAVARPSLR